MHIKPWIFCTATGIVVVLLGGICELLLQNASDRSLSRIASSNAPVVSSVTTTGLRDIPLATAREWRGVPPPQPARQVRMTSAYRSWRLSFAFALSRLERRRRTSAIAQELRDWQVRYEKWIVAGGGAGEPALSSRFSHRAIRALVSPPPRPACATFYGYQVVLPWNNAVYSYPVKTFPAGTPYLLHANGISDGGIPLRERPDVPGLMQSAGVDDPVARNVLVKVSGMEGGFDAVNTWDTGYVSAGFIQFTTGETGEGHSLVQVLERMKSEEAGQSKSLPRHVNEFFAFFTDHGIDVRGGQLYVHDPYSDATRSGAEAVRLIIDDKRLTAILQDAGARSRAYQLAQIREAYGAYYLAKAEFRIPVAEIREMMPGEPSPTSESNAFSQEQTQSTTHDQQNIHGKADTADAGGAAPAENGVQPPDREMSPAKTALESPVHGAPSPGTPAEKTAAVHYVFGNTAVQLALARSGNDNQYQRGVQASRGGRPRLVVTRLPDLVGTYGDILSSEGGRLTLMDRAVQHGVRDATETFVQALNSLSQDDAVTLASLRVHERELITALHNRIDLPNSSSGR